MNFLDHDRAKYEELGAVAAYSVHSPGERYAPMFCELVGVGDERGTVLDAGCCTGKGGLVLAAAGFDVTLCDYTAANLAPETKHLPFKLVRTLWDREAMRQVALHVGHWGRTTFDYAFCCDVMEHIPREFTMLTAHNLMAITRHGAFFSIALTPDGYGAWVGRQLHETVESFVWWRDRLKEFGTLEDARDLGHVGIYYVRPR
jgi:2-polyprenyl-3-methyl-5-hydroxy-6-metoxy-1,4-benzoquinol methylase